jgi:hypothetical protein
MAKDASAGDQPGLGEFRKRIPLELAPDDLVRLRALQPPYGSMRATLLAGLEALDRVERAEADQAVLVEARSEAEARVRELEAEVAALQEASASHAAKAKRASSATKGDADRAAARIRALESEATGLRRDLAGVQQTLDATYQTLLEFDETRVDELRCPRCGEFAPSEEWGYEQAEEGGQLIFHQPCGYHEGGLLDQGSILGYRHAG